ncbi:MAG: hypothetical protein ACJA1C_000243 [Crocinitomicaceae bacterium]|jgi:hypothetical protein
MKKSVALLALCMSGIAFSQQPELVNGFDGFENWVPAETGELPEYWDGFNKDILFGGMTVGTIECIEKSNTDPYEGMYSAKLTSTSIMGGPAVPAILTVGDFVVDWNAQDGDVEGGEAYTDSPTELFGQFKYAPSGLDTGFVSVWFMENGVEVGRGRFDFTETSGGWTAFSVAIGYDAGAAPDSMNVMFSSSNSDASSIPAGTVLEIDAIGFGNFLSIETLKPKSMRCFPNPTTDKVTIELEKSTTGQVQIVDQKGVVLKVEQFSGDSISIDLLEFPAGMYQLLVTDETGMLSETIVVD